MRRLKIALWLAALCVCYSGLAAASTLPTFNGQVSIPATHSAWLMTNATTNSVPFGLSSQDGWAIQYLGVDYMDLWAPCGTPPLPCGAVTLALPGVNGPEFVLGTPGSYNPNGFLYSTGYVSPSSQTTTSGSFIIPAQGSAVSVTTAAALPGPGFYVWMQISDGTHTVIFNNGGNGGTTTTTLTAVYITAGAAGNTMGSGATVKPAAGDTIQANNIGFSYAGLSDTGESIFDYLVNWATPFPGNAAVYEIRDAATHEVAFPNGAVAPFFAAQGHNACSATSGFPCETTGTCSIGATTTCNFTKTVPATSVCTATGNGSDTTTGVESWNLALASTTLTCKVTVASSQTSTAGANIHCS